MQTQDISAIAQLGFSIVMCWYLLTSFSKKLESLSTLISDSQKTSVLSTTESKEMFTEIKELIKETCSLVGSTSEAVKIQSELTKAALDRLERLTVVQFAHVPIPPERG